MKIETTVLSVLAVLALVASPARADTLLGQQAAACRPGAGGTAVVVRAEGLKDRTGTLRVQVYDNDADRFLDKGERLSRVDATVPASGPVRLCVPLPAPGRYALYVRHNRSGQSKASFSKDGFGFSRNPHLRLAKPDHSDVVMPFGTGVTEIAVMMNYRTGLLSVGPVEKR